jgi:hypothetical protein
MSSNGGLNSNKKRVIKEELYHNQGGVCPLCHGLMRNEMRGATNGGRWDIDNLQVVYHACNSKIG